MLRPNVRALLKELSLSEVIKKLESFIANNPKKEFYLSNIDLLRLYGKALRKDDFYKLALFLTSNIRNPAVYREVARFSYFIEKDSSKAKFYAEKAILINNNEPLWVHYIARVSRTYLEKLYDGVYLTSIPKNASTSLKSMVLEELHEKKGVNPHSVFGNPFFSINNLDKSDLNSDLKLLSLREPISRFISYHNKNILEESSLQEELNYTKKEFEFGLDLKPNLEEFVNKINIYCYIFNDVLHHILPQTAYFNELTYYDCVADLKSSYKLGEAVSKKLKLKNKISPPKKMVSTKKVKSIDLSDNVQSTLEKLFKDDVLMFENFESTKEFNKTFSFDFK